MIEIIDNAVQLGVAAVSCAIAITWFLRRRQTAYFFLVCHFCSYAFGAGYWLLYLIFMDRTPQVFYVSDLSWMASTLFLAVLLIDRAPAKERAVRHPLLPLTLLFGVGMTVFFCHWGDVLANILWDGMVAGLMFLAVRGLIYLKKTGDQREARGLLVTVLLFCLCEYCLWTCSCYNDIPLMVTLYYVFDVAMTCIDFAILFAAEKAVRA